MFRLRWLPGDDTIFLRVGCIIFGYSTLYASVWDRSRHRDLRANELMSICVVLGINPMDFVDDPDKKDVV